MVEPPVGTVTFLFTDIEGSTNLLDRLGAELYGEVLSEQRQIIRNAFERYAGSEIDTQGDAFFASFPRATQAVAAVVDIQRQLADHEWPDGASVRVRMGLHTGEPWLIEEGYVGMDVHRAARIAHVGHGGQVLLSETTTALVVDMLPEGVELADLGRHRLKDMRRHENLHQLVIEGIPSSFAPLNSLGMVAPPRQKGEEGATRIPREVSHSPYQGLTAFQEKDAAFFFGRESFTDRLANKLTEQQMVAVIVGPSGSGKSSTVFAGILPQLREGGEWLIVKLRPGREPFHALAGALVPLLDKGLGNIDHLKETQKLAQAMRTGELPLYQVIESIIESHPTSQRILLVIDQFEELYTLCPNPAIRKAFQEELMAALASLSRDRHSFLSILLTLRADFMGQALQYRPFADALQDASILLGPMNREELRTAIERPAELQGAAFETGLVDRLLDDVGQEPGNLPLLEFALTLLWEQMEQGWLTHKTYEEIGRVEGSLARYADQVYSELSPRDKEGARLAFVQLIQPGEGTEDTRRVARRQELVGVDWELVQYLADKRLVVTGLDESGSETVEVVHEALIRGWARMRKWMDENRDFRRWQEGLRAAILAWNESDHDDGALLRGAPLAQAEEWLANRGGEIGDSERIYIETSIAHQKRQQQRRQRRRRFIVVGLAIGLVVALLLSALALSQRSEAVSNAERAESNAATAAAAQVEALSQAENAQAQADARATQQAVAESEVVARSTQQAIAESEAAARATAQAIVEKEAREASSRNIAAAAIANLNIDPQLSLLLAIQAVRQTYEVDGSVLPEAQNALHQTVQDVSRLELVVPGKGNRMPIITYSADGRRLIVHRFPASPGPTTQPDNTSTSVYSSSTGELLYTLPEGIIIDYWPTVDQIGIGNIEGEQLEVTLWNIDDGTLDASISLDRPETLDSGNIAALLLDPSHMYLVAFWVNGFHAGAWDLVSGELISNWSPAAVLNTTIRQNYLLNTGTHFENRLPSPVTFTGDGDRVLSYINQGNIFFWDWKTGEDARVTEVDVRMGIIDPLMSLAPDDSFIALASRPGGFIEMWDYKTWETIGLISYPPDTKLTTVAISPDSSLLGVASNDGVIKVWELAYLGNELESNLLLALFDPQSEIHTLRFSPDGERLASGSRDGTVKVWDIRPNGGEELPSIINADLNEPQKIDAIALSPDGRQLAFAVNGQAPVIKDTITGEELFTLGDESPGMVEQLRYSPSGSQIAICAHGGPLMLWDSQSGALLAHMEDLSAESCSFDFFPDGSGLGLGFFRNETGWYYPYNLPELVEGQSLQLDPPAPWNAQAPHIGATASLTYNSNGTRLGATSSFGELFVWDLEEQGPSGDVGENVNPSYTASIDNLIFQGGRVYQEVLFLPTGNRMVTTGVDGRISLWDADEMDPLFSFPAHQGTVWKVKFSPDESRLVSAGDDGLTKLWDAATGDELLALTGHSGAVTDLAISPDGKMLYTAGDDGDVRAYLLDIDELLDLAESRVIRNLTAEECQRYLLTSECPAD